MSKPLDSLTSAWRGRARGLRRRLLPFSDYDHTIPPEIVDDELYRAIRNVAATARVKTMLEIGSSDGAGSTRAFVAGMMVNAASPVLYCLELSRPRFRKLSARYATEPRVKCYNLTSVSLDRFPGEEEVIAFYRDHESKLNRVPLREVLRWLHQDRRYVEKLIPTDGGIRTIKRENGIDRFGVVLIDGSEFTGRAELDEVYGADFIVLDDIGTFKNSANYERLLADPAYQLTAENKDLRNGYAVFALRSAAPAAER